MNGGKPTTAGVPGMVSSTLTWEKIYNTNIGIDLGMLDNRLNATAEYFIRRTKDMVGPAAEVGAILGTSLPNTKQCRTEK